MKQAAYLCPENFRGAFSTMQTMIQLCPTFCRYNLRYSSTFTLCSSIVVFCCSNVSRSNYTFLVKMSWSAQSDSVTNSWNHALFSAGYFPPLPGVLTTFKTFPSGLHRSFSTAHYSTKAHTFSVNLSIAGSNSLPYVLGHRFYHFVPSDSLSVKQFTSVATQATRPSNHIVDLLQSSLGTSSPVPFGIFRRNAWRPGALISHLKSASSWVVEFPELSSSFQRFVEQFDAFNPSNAAILSPLFHLCPFWAI